MSSECHSGRLVPQQGAKRSESGIPSDVESAQAPIRSATAQKELLNEIAVQKTFARAFSCTGPEPSTTLPTVRHPRVVGPIQLKNSTKADVRWAPALIAAADEGRQSALTLRAFRFQPERQLPAPYARPPRAHRPSPWHHYIRLDSRVCWTPAEPARQRLFIATRGVAIQVSATQALIQWR
jgi:hypothetical protein